MTCVDVSQSVSAVIHVGVLSVLSSLACLPCQHAFAIDVVLSLPRPFEVIQREGFVVRRAHVNNPGGPELGHGQVAVVFETGSVCQEATWEFRVEALHNAFGKSQDWQELSVECADQVYSASAKVPAGGWYRLDVRGRAKGVTVAAGSIEPFGVGEVFLIAGQSYAAGENDAHLKILDPQGRVVAFDIQDRSWKVANDPFPNVGDGGTIWPPMGNALLPFVRVPIGFVNVAVSGTSSRQWLPGTPLFDRLKSEGESAGRFRMVLWQQGESDVLEGTTTDQYVANLMQIRVQLDQHWNKSTTWLLAKSTLHPTVYNNPAGEEQIRSAVDVLCQRSGFRPGPDTDILGGKHRGGLGSRRHFSELGQRRAGLLWFTYIWNALQSGDADSEDRNREKVHARRKD